MSAIKIYSNDSLLIVMWDHRPPGRFAPHDKICDILRAAIKSRISADMLSLRIWYSVIIHITYSLLHTRNFFQMLMQINRSNWGNLQKGALCPMLLYPYAPIAMRNTWMALCDIPGYCGWIFCKVVGDLCYQLYKMSLIDFHPIHLCNWSALKWLCNML